MTLPGLARPLPAVAAVSTALTGLAFVGVGVGSVAANSKTFGIGVAAMLLGYGAGLILIAWVVARGHRWGLGLIVASSLLHASAVASFLTSDDRTQTTLMLAIGAVVATTLVSSVWAFGRGELSAEGDDRATPGR